MRRTRRRVSSLSSQGAPLPEGWRNSTLGQAGTWSSGRTLSREKPEYFFGSILWVKISDLNDGIVTSTEEYLSEAGLQAGRAKMLPQGTLCVGMYGSIGKAGLLGFPAVTNQACANCVIDTRTVNPSFLLYYVISQRSELHTAGRGSGQRNINITLMRRWPLPIPPLREQENIVHRIGKLLAHIRKAREHLDRAGYAIKMFRIGALDAACSGRICGHPDKFE